MVVLVRRGCSRIGQVVLGHPREDRQEFRRIERLAGDVGEDLDAEKAERVDRPFGFGNRRVDVGHRQARACTDEAIGMSGDERRHLVVGDPAQSAASAGVVMLSILGPAIMRICRASGNLSMIEKRSERSVNPRLAVAYLAYWLAKRPSARRLRSCR